MNKATLEKMLKIIKSRDFSEKNIGYMIEAIEKELAKKEEKKNRAEQDKDIRVREFIGIVKGHIGLFDSPVVFNAFTVRKIKDFFVFTDSKEISFPEIIATLKYYLSIKNSTKDLNEFIRRFMYYYNMAHRQKKESKEHYYFEEI